jgi:hypothetical protein
VFNWFSKKVRSEKPRSARAGVKRRSCRPWLERLEDRWVPTFALRYSLDGGVTFSPPVFDGGTGSIDVSLGAFSLHAVSQNFQSPSFSTIAVSISGQAAPGPHDIVVQASADGIPTAPAPQTLFYGFTGSILPSGSATMETWVDNSNTLFGTTGGQIAADTGSQSVPHSASLPFTGTTPYSATAQIHAIFTTVVGGATSVSLDNQNDLTPSSLAVPTINTQQQPPTATVGSSIADQATVSGGSNPTGTVTFRLFNNPNGTGTPLFIDTEPLAGGMATSAGYTALATGTDYWVATYNGDSNNSPVTSGTALEPVAITPASPAINTQQQPASATVGSSIADKATVSGGFNPTGTVTFKLYNNPNGTGTPLFTDTETLAGGMATSAGYTALATGTDYWVATYNGDSNNSPVTSGTADEPVVITGGKTTPIGSGQSATLGFWKNAGQAVILNFNGSPGSTALGNWLAANFGNLFGSFAGHDNTYVANQFKTGGTSNTYQQAFAVALDIYATTLSLGGASVISGGYTTKYGFKVTDAGDMFATWDVGRANAAAFDIPPGGSTVLTLYQILTIANNHYNATTGQFYNGDSNLNNELNVVLNAINERADIK